MILIDLVPRVFLEYLGDSIELPVGETVIGRDVQCALRFNDPAISRRHLRFIHRADEVFVEDLGSSNGTRLNTYALAAPTRLNDGDTVGLGNRELTVRIVTSEKPEPKTVQLKNFNTAKEIEKIAGRVTAQLPIAKPPDVSQELRNAIGGTGQHQRCPKCGAQVTATDDECARCHYKWGAFRPAAATGVGDNPISRRRHDRHSVELNLVYISSELEIEATTRDLSESGVFVCTQVLDPIGTSCQLTILVDGGPPLQINGVVRRVVEREDEGDEPVGLGVEFVSIGAAERAWLDRVVRAQSTSST